jgi:hypothetical protein
MRPIVIVIVIDSRNTTGFSKPDFENWINILE